MHRLVVVVTVRLWVMWMQVDFILAGLNLHVVRKKTSFWVAVILVDCIIKLLIIFRCLIIPADWFISLKLNEDPLDSV